MTINDLGSTLYFLLAMALTVLMVIVCAIVPREFTYFLFIFISIFSFMMGYAAKEREN